MSGRQHMLPVWFFVGMLLTVYGVVILFTSIDEWSHPPAVVLAQYHPGVWGGILLLLIGGFYTIRFRPRRRGGK
jgi:hypothetical protein